MPKQMDKEQGSLFFFPESHVVICDLTLQGTHLSYISVIETFPCLNNGMKYIAYVPQRDPPPEKG